MIRRGLRILITRTPATTYCGHNRNLRAIRYARRESAGVADILSANEDVDVLADLILLIEYSIPYSRIGIPKRKKGLGYGCA